MHLHIPSKKDAIATASYIQSVALSYPIIHFIDLSLVDFPFKNTHNPVAFLSLIIDKHKSFIEEAIKRTSCSSSPPATALIIDLFSATMIEVGKELGIPTYLYFTSGTALLGLCSIYNTRCQSSLPHHHLPLLPPHVELIPFTGDLHESFYIGPKDDNLNRWPAEVPLPSTLLG
ncbi:hypothetical protein MRB53_007193 [Persea americana]|uniref:Uncharacterized protein n=1 Tax=Persea americana TaxID=3435 RepID=A0ACC2MIA9_PERAE|nr:hypothetical protein MRB53_007193 [Persea americana]